MTSIKTKILDWWHGWNEPYSWERDACAILDVVVKENQHAQRNHTYDKDCWCSACLRDTATSWVNAYWERRLKRSSVQAQLVGSSLTVTQRQKLP